MCVVQHRMLGREMPTTTTTTRVASRRISRKAATSTAAAVVDRILIVLVAAIAITMLPSSSLPFWKTAGVRAFAGARSPMRNINSSIDHRLVNGSGPRTTPVIAARTFVHSSRLLASVTGTVYTANNSNDSDNDNTSNGVVVTLYTKEGCTLCDKVKAVLSQVKDQEGFAHSLRQTDITDADQGDSYDRYKYDIPVLHINANGDGDSDEDVYWTKHRLTEQEAKDALTEAMKGSFEERKGRPNAAALER